MSAAFTPGPWTYEVHELSNGYSAIVYDAIDRAMADHLSEADARLIAAAPEMFEVLWKIARGEFNCSPHQRFMAAQVLAEEVIAKARGEQVSA